MHGNRLAEKMQVERKLTAILAADVVGFSRMMGVDEAGTLRTLKTLERDLVDPVVTRHGGRIFKKMGDGYLATFPSVVSAIDCALRWQEGALATVRYRIGINIGDVIVDGEDFYGEGVNIAARLEGLANSGGICISEDAWRYARGKVQAVARDLGEQTLKNIATPVRAFELSAGEVAVAAGPQPEREVASDRVRLRRVLLSPFRRLGSNENAELLAGGLTETLAAALAHFEEFELIAPGIATCSVAQDGALAAGRSLGAHYVLEGTVQVAGPRVRVVCQLVDVDSGRRVWSETLNRAGDDIFEMQDDITAFVASTMGDAVGEEQVRASAHKPLAELDTDQRFIRGLGLLHRGDCEGNAEAHAILEAVCAVDRESMLPTLCLSWVHTQAARFGWPHARSDALAYAHGLADDLMRRFPRSAHVHRLQCHILLLERDHDAGLAHARRAYDLNPWHADMMLCMAWALLVTGDAEASIEHFERGFATNPYLADHFKRNLSLAYFLAGRPGDGLSILDGSGADAAGARLHRIVNHVALGQMPQASAEARQLLCESPEFRAGALPMFGAFRKATDREKILSALEEAGVPR